VNYQFIARLATSDTLVIAILADRGVLLPDELRELEKLLKMRGSSEGSRRGVETALRAVERARKEKDGN